MIQGAGQRKLGANKYEKLRRKSLAFLAALFKRRRLMHVMRISTETQQQPSLAETAARPVRMQESGGGFGGEASVSRVSSTISVSDVGMMQACRQAASRSTIRGASPSHSILTLTPGRTRNIDQDMEALRLSRQDNPYLQVLASKENLIESIEESESDDATLMSQEFGDADPLTLAQVHEHLVRSPPPVSWSRTPMFHFPQQQQQQQENQSFTRTSSPRPRTADEQTRSEASVDIRADRHSHTFSLLNPTPIRSLSEVRRLHRSAEDSVQLMSSE